MTKETIQIKDANGKNRHGKTTKLSIALILKAILHKDNIEKN